ncbi:hypothetical protein ACF8O8_18020 [Pseudomonas sp. TYF_14]|uniref:hypothetical protein n=1 Tax=Pseudomonas sp. TYF_14 TaxID=3367193 RepID=UPI00370AEEC9
MQRQLATRGNPLSAPFATANINLDTPSSYSQRGWANGRAPRLGAYIGINCNPVWEQALPDITVSFPVFLTNELYGDPAKQTAGVAPRDTYSVRVDPPVKYLPGAMKHQLDVGYIPPAGRTGDVGETDVHSGLDGPQDRDALIFTYQTAL